MSQRRLLAVSKDDITYNFMYQIGVMFDEEKDTRHVEITYTASYHAPEDINKEENTEDFSSFLNSSIVLTYRFIRDYTKDVEDSWTINALNHVSVKDIHKDFYQ